MAVVDRSAKGQLIDGIALMVGPHDAWGDHTLVQGQGLEAVALPKDG
ncbi:hypothetical protein [Cyanobium sp. Morenito 9A2]|nr:hypothetical protein [Cyanobium sp. Morenito 9A2]MCP9849547.1 hypothetical protein [Cyanobium sp. Morenito 9A2]